MYIVQRGKREAQKKGEWEGGKNSGQSGNPCSGVFVPDAYGPVRS
jgi:hypothetical protein